MTKATREQFEVIDNQIRHVPTGATFLSYPGESGFTNVIWGNAGMVLPNGEEYDKDELFRLANALLQEGAPH